MVTGDIVDFFRKDNKPELPYILAIIGEPGIGKTLFAKCMID